MGILNFPFSQFSPTDIPRPWLPIIIKNPHTDREMKSFGLIDTGADECAIPASLATLLGHNLQEGIQKDINTGNGITTAYSHTMCIKVGDITIDNILIDFLPNLNVVLLGAKNFLNNFILTVDYQKLSFSLKQIPKS